MFVYMYNEYRLYQPMHYYSFESNIKQKSFKIKHNIKSKYISFEAKFILDDTTTRYGSAHCITNDELEFSFEKAFILDIDIQDCKK